MSFLKRLFGARSKQGSSAPFTAPLAPDAPFYVIGDIHGRLDLFDRLIAKIDAEDPDGTCPLVLVGDYIDRGEQSAQVLQRIQELLVSGNRELVCLMGNHEDMLLKFLEDPAERGARWLRYGGLQTLASFRVGAITEKSAPDAMKAARDALQDAMGPDLIEWMAGLRTHWQSGNVAVVHAAADPGVPIDIQDPRTLKWGHPEFNSVTRTDNVWVVHGHTIVDQANAENGRIATDTGAYATGNLTAAFISADSLRFLRS